MIIELYTFVNMNLHWLCNLCLLLPISIMALYCGLTKCSPRWVRLLALITWCKIMRWVSVKELLRLWTLPT